MTGEISSKGDLPRESLPVFALLGIIALLIAWLAGGPSASESLRLAKGGLADKWWNDRVFYEIFIRSFQDSDGDGIGDIQGIIERLDYLNDGDPATDSDLGITGIWLMPPFEAHSYHGYDVTDYYAIEADYGSEADMRRLVAEAHERGIAVIIDMVINHTSSRHPWFMSARIGEPDYADWYIWAEEDPGYAGSWGAPAWHRAGGRHYYGVFWDGMPDLNLENAAVRQELYDVAAFWLGDIGVDGFRLDAVKHLIEVGESQENRPESRDWLAEYEAHLESVKPHSFTVGEVFGGAAFIVARYVTDGGIDMGFDFNLADKMISAAQRGTNRDIARAHQIVTREYPPNQFAAFLTNHDQDRLANRLLFDSGKNKVAASLLLTGPGLPFLYYGEEIGMTGTKPDERLRRPMQWDASPFAGFTTGDAVWQPMNDRGNIASANVALQSADPDSLLSHYRALIHARNDNSALRRGHFTPVDSGSRQIYAFLRHDAEQTLLVLINLSGDAIVDNQLDFAGGGPPLGAPRLVHGQGEVMAPAISADGGFVGYQPLPRLDPHSLVILAF